MTSLSEICRILAAKEVLLHANYEPTNPDSPSASNAFYWRRIARLYSTLFHTPLREVYDLPQDFVFQNVYEYRFEEMSEDTSTEGEQKWFDLLDRLADTDEEGIVRLEQERKDKLKSDEFANQVANEEKRKDELLRKKGIIKNKQIESGDYIPYNVRKQIEDAAKKVQAVLDGKSDEFSMKFESLPTDD